MTIIPCYKYIVNTFMHLFIIVYSNHLFILVVFYIKNTSRLCFLLSLPILPYPLRIPTTLLGIIHTLLIRQISLNDGPADFHFLLYYTEYPFQTRRQPKKLGHPSGCPNHHSLTFCSWGLTPIYHFILIFHSFSD